MKKLFITLAILFATFSGLSSYANETKIEVVPTMKSESTAPNRIWVGTFQIVWNEFMSNIVKGPIKFIGFDSKMANDLNEKSFKTSDISDDAYYTKYGLMTPETRREIEKALLKKFNEKSDILHLFDWAKNSTDVIIYAMLKKDFKFIKAFDKLTPQYFGKNTKAEVEYFGINEDSNAKLYKNVEVMFYNSTEDFAVKLFTKNNDVVMLYRTNDDKTFDKYYSDMRRKSQFYLKNRKFTNEDRLKVPNINLYQKTSFPELEGHSIKGSDYVIGETIETIDFKMDNEGVKLKSEAAIIAKCSLVPPSRGRHFMFTDNFVLFLAEKGKRTPYYAMKISDVDAINKTGKK